MPHPDIPLTPDEVQTLRRFLMVDITPEISQALTRLCTDYTRKGYALLHADDTVDLDRRLSNLRDEFELDQQELMRRLGTLKAPPGFRLPEVPLTAEGTV